MIAAPGLGRHFHPNRSPITAVPAAQWPAPGGPPAGATSLFSLNNVFFSLVSAVGNLISCAMRPGLKPSAAGGFEGLIVRVDINHPASLLAQAHLFLRTRPY